MQSNKSRFNKSEQAVLKTLIYSDIFNFPLTKNELWKFLISKEKISRDLFEKSLLQLINFEKFDIFNFDKQIVYKDGYFCLAARESIIQKRKKNKVEVQKKLRIAYKAAYYLSFIPSIQYIGISGGLAINNVGESDDIDFFIITKKHTLFITRFLILMLLELLNLRRKRNETNAPNKICVNLLIDETRLSWPDKSRDLYIAHEIIQTRVLFERNEMSKKFYDANNWVKEFFPNFNKRQSFISEKSQTNYFTLQFISFFLTLWPLERLMQKLQEFYMKKHKTTEIVSKAFIALHPKDYKFKTMEILRSKCEKLGLLTNF
jgi:hypothetical protein